MHPEHASYTLGWHSGPLSRALHPDALQLWERICNTVHPHQHSAT
jgi:hypothetical protein